MDMGLLEGWGELDAQGHRRDPDCSTYWVWCFSPFFFLSLNLPPSLAVFRPGQGPSLLEEPACSSTHSPHECPFLPEKSILELEAYVTRQRQLISLILRTSLS